MSAPSSSSTTDSQVMQTPRETPRETPRGSARGKRGSLTALSQQGAQAVLVQVLRTPRVGRTLSTGSAGVLSRGPTGSVAGLSAVLEVPQAEQPPVPFSASTIPELITQVGMGPYQIMMLGLLACFPFCESSALITISAQSRALQTEWSLNSFQTGSLASASFAGLALGTYASGAVADVYGRRSAIILGFSLMSLVGGLLPLATGYYSMLLLQIWLGFSCGLGVPASQAMITEMTPSLWRPMIFVIWNSFSCVGELYACLGMIQWMPDLENPAHWRALSVWAAIPPVVSLLASVALMQESAHWLAVKGCVGEARLVLQQMALMNGRPEAVAHLGPAEGLAGDGDQSPAQRTTSPRGQMSLKDIMWELLSNSNNLKKLFLFSALCIVGNMTTFGMGYFWPVLLRSAAGEGSSRGYSSPAQELLVMRMSGLPAGLFSFFAVSRKEVGHRAVLFFCGPVGALALLVVALHQSPTAILASCIVSTIVGVTSYSVSLIFVNESFPTQIRSTAVGFSVMLGRTGAMVAPLLVERLGQESFLAVVICAFAASVLAAIPLQETKGKELGDFTSSSGADADIAALQSPRVPPALGASDGTASGSTLADSETEEEHDPHGGDGARLFAEGTLGSRLELLLLAAGLGALPGAATSAYLCSLGYFSQLLRDEGLFAHQLLAISGSAAVVLVLRWAGDVARERSGRSSWTPCGLLLSTVAASELLALVTVSTWAVQSRTGVIAVGCVVGVLAAMVYASGLELAATVSSAAVLWVQAGGAVGAALPVATSLLVGFGPGANQASRLMFFSMPAMICMVGGAVYWWYLQQLTGLAQFLELRPALAARRRSDRSSTLLGASAAFEPPEGQLLPWLRAAPGAALLTMAAWTNVLLGAACSAALAGMLPSLGGPWQAQSMFLYKVIGELIGRLIALAGWGFGSNDGGTSPGTSPMARRPTVQQLDPDAAAGGGRRPAQGEWLPKQAARPVALVFLLSTLQIVGAVLLVLPIAAPKWSWMSLRQLATNGVLVWGVFGVSALGALSGSCLEAIVPLVVPMAARHAAVRAQAVVSSSGASIGLLAAACWHASRGDNMSSAFIIGLAGQLGSVPQNGISTTKAPRLPEAELRAPPAVPGLVPESLAGPNEASHGALLMRRQIVDENIGPQSAPVPRRPRKPDRGRRAVQVLPGRLQVDEAQ